MIKYISRISMLLQSSDWPGSWYGSETTAELNFQSLASFSPLSVLSMQFGISSYS